MAERITVEDVAAAERILGIEYTPAERQQLLESLEERLALLASRKENALANGVPPATLFAPWLLAPDHSRLSGAGEGSSLHAETEPVAVRQPLRKPPDDSELLYSSLEELAGWLREGVVSSVSLTKLALERLQEANPTLHCVVTFTEELALEQAAQADRELRAGKDRGLLHGIPYGMKDIVDTACIATTWGATPYQARVPGADATVTRLLEDAGAVMVAKLSCGALAYGDLWFRERTRNPWNPETGSSGSSAGSAAAVAAGLVPFAIGSETYGSIVSPSMQCGTVGLRPTFGTVSRSGAMALSFGFDKLGPITRRAEDALSVLQAISHADANDPESVLSHSRREHVGGTLARRHETSLEGLVVGYDDSTFDDPGFYGKADELVRELKRRGATLTPIEMPEMEAGSLMTAMLAEAASHHEELTLSNRDDQLRWQDDAAWPNVFRSIRFLSAVDYVQMQRLRTQVIRAVAERLERVDAYIAPSFARDLVALTNLSGHPAVVVPVGLGENRLPQGISVCGAWFGEAAMIRVAKAIEQASTYLEERPPLGSKQANG
jgi:Asp-tRNA(Asn)/Glu-tRNA(Gln) amidotransferase A subunit family amidase